MSKPIKVLIVDDSALMRQLLSAILESDPEIKVVGTAPHPLKAREMIKQFNPDVLTLDIDMPKMNGLDFLKKIMRLRPMPVVMISSLTQAGASITLQSLEIGAVDFIAKPQIDLERGLYGLSQEIIKKVKMAAEAQIRPFTETLTNIEKVQPTLLASSSYYKNLIAIGASTGGVEALRVILSALPIQMPPIMIVQHMPKQFTASFAKRLNSLCDLRVCEAEDGQRLEEGHVYIAPGDRHLTKAIGAGGEVTCRLLDSEPVQGHKPSVNVLFDSLVGEQSEDLIAMILTGMGRDGASGLKSLHENGAVTFSQNHSSSTVYGMPKAAVDLGAVDYEMDVKHMAFALVQLCHTGKLEVK